VGGYLRRMSRVCIPNMDSHLVDSSKASFTPCPYLAVNGFISVTTIKHSVPTHVWSQALEKSTSPPFYCPTCWP